MDDDIFLSSDKNPNEDKGNKKSSPLPGSTADKLQKDFEENQEIKIDEIIETMITEMEQDKNLQTKFPDEVKLLRKHWKTFSSTFQKLLNA